MIVEKLQYHKIVQREKSLLDDIESDQKSSGDFDSWTATIPRI
jgi:hypothetical protein